MNELPWTIPGGQQVQFTPHRLGGGIGSNAVVVGTGTLASENYVAATSGWIINGDGTVEFEDGEFRGDITGATGTFAGTISADNVTAGTLTGSALSVGSGNNIFRVNADGDLWIGHATEGSAPFRVDNTGNLTATSGTFSGTVSAASFEGVNSLPNSAANELKSANFSSGSAGWQIKGNGDAEFNDITARGTIENDDGSGNGGTWDSTGFCFTVSTEGSSWNSSSGIEWKTDAGVHLGKIGAYKLLTAESALFIEVDDTANAQQLLIKNNSTGEGLGNIIIQTMDTDSGDIELTSAHDIFLDAGSEDIVCYAEQIYFGSSGADGHIGDWPSGSGYQGLHHASLASDYMIMSDGTDTFIGADDEIKLRPNGNSGGQMILHEGHTNNIQMRGQAGTATFPTYSFEGDSNSGWYRPSADTIRAVTNGSTRMQWNNTGVEIYNKFFCSGLTSSSTTSGNPLWHYTAGGDEIYEYTSTGRLKANQRDRSRADARSVLSLRPKVFDPMWQDKDGTTRPVLEPGAAKDPIRKGQLYDVVGLIAEDVAVDFPDAAIHDEAGAPVNIDWNAITTSLIGVIQDLDERLGVLEGSLGV